MTIALMSITQLTPYYTIPTVPRLFLQPFIENSILHGFDNIDYIGKISIVGEIDNEKRCFYVVDNGKGMSEELIRKVMAAETDTIGVNNVIKRIRLIYGENYGVEFSSHSGSGTRVIITLPII